MPEINHPDPTSELPGGFSFAAASAAIKKPGRLDVGIILADKLCSAAAAFTTNRFCAAPVEVSRQTLMKSAGRARGVAVNSGCANAATGELGMANAATMADTAAKMTDAAGEPFLVCSTGVIGVQLPMDRIREGIAGAAAALSRDTKGFTDFADSILTTDTRRKTAFARMTIGDKPVRIAACAKGAGMIAPNMATLLAFVVTDACISPDNLRTCFHQATDRSLNCLTVDGDMSTNDTAIVLASGASGVCVDADPSTLARFQDALLEVMQSISRQLARDGEGATKLIEIGVHGAPTFADARKVALAIANSNLVKTAIYGRDANWGRIACAAGYSGYAVSPEKVSIDLGPIRLFEKGAPIPFDEDQALRVLGSEEIAIRVHLGDGNEAATVWTCDLTEGYIKVNASYRT